MNDIFSPIELSWAGKTYKVPSSGVLELVCIVEETITMHELTQMARRGTAPAGKLAKAFGAVLRHMGAKVADEEVFAAMFRQKTAEEVGVTIKTLLMMLLPKSAYEATNTASTSPGNASRGAGKSSKNSSRRQSKANGLPHPKSSGASAPSRFGG